MTRFIAAFAGTAFAAAAVHAAAGTALPAADEAAAFKAAGFSLKGKQWRGGCDDPGNASYEPATIDVVRDLNGDGLPEAVIREGGTYCYGFTGEGFFLVSKQPHGHWKLITSDIGIPRFLSTRGTGGWPDIQVGGPGFCFPVQRWNGRSYALNRREYQGKPCKE